MVMQRWILALLLALVALPAFAARSLGPVAYWRFETGSGTTATDESGLDNDGTISGATFSPVVPMLPADQNNAFSLLFDAEGDYVTVPTEDTALDELPIGITVEAFILPAALPIPLDGAGGRVKYIVWAHDDTYSLALRSDAMGATTLVGSVNAVNGAPGPCTANVAASFDNATSFSHVAITYGFDETLRLFLDGVQVATDDAAPGCGATVGPVGASKVLRIGNDETATLATAHDRNFRGNIDEVRISPRALDPREFLNATHDLTASFDTVVDGCENTGKSFECALDGTLELQDEGETYAAAGFALSMTCKLGVAPSCKVGGALDLTQLDLVGIPVHQVAFYLSSDTTLDANDPLLGTLESTRVAKSFASAKAVKAKFKVPKGVDLSDQRIIAVVDPDDRVPETDEDNNADASGALPALP
jgi:hypothetical protein